MNANAIRRIEKLMAMDLLESRMEQLSKKNTGLNAIEYENAERSVLYQLRLSQGEYFELDYDFIESLNGEWWRGGRYVYRGGVIELSCQQAETIAESFKIYPQIGRLDHDLQG